MTNLKREAITASQRRTEAPICRGKALYLLSWEELGRALHILAERLQAAGFYPDTIIPIAMGGLVPGTYFHHVFPKAEVHIMRARRNISTEIFSSKTTPAISSFASPMNCEGHDVLIVDDIVGTGATLEAVKASISQQGPRAVVNCSLACNWAVATRPEYFAFDVDDWVVFPWERLTLAAQYYEHRSLLTSAPAT